MALIKQALERRTNKTIILQTRIQPDILGGVIARVGDQLIDGSVRYRLSSLRQQLLNSAANSHGKFLSETEANEIVARTEQAPENTQQDWAEPSPIQ
jgi:F-type H+-transporting ATPase subunit delta